MSVDLGDDKFSDTFKKELENKLDIYWSDLLQTNQIRREKDENERWQRERERIQKEEQYKALKTVGKTGGGALAGAGVGALIGGPPGAAIGFFLGGIFGFNS